MFNVLLVIDTLGSGGAQRQMCLLAGLLKKNGYSVKVVSYHDNKFFLKSLLDDGVDVVTVPRPLGRLERLFFVWKQIRISRPELVCAFLTVPSLFVELGRLVNIGKFRVVVSERHLDAKVSTSIFIRFIFHFFSDLVIANSFAQKLFIETSAPWLRRKLRCIRNCVDTDKFFPVEKAPSKNRKLQIIVLASYTDNKNVLGLLRGVDLAVKALGGGDFVITWYGNKRGVFDSNGNPTYRLFDAACSLRDELGLRDVVEFNEDTSDVVSLYHSADIFCLPSLSEATPNVICEAMASGLPVVASMVGDIEDIVVDGVNGFLFDPICYQDISAALQKIILLSDDLRKQIGINNRQRAIELFGQDGFLRQYIDAFSCV